MLADICRGSRDPISQVFLLQFADMQALHADVDYAAICYCHEQLLSRQDLTHMMLFLRPGHFLS